MSSQVKWMALFLIIWSATVAVILLFMKQIMWLGIFNIFLIGVNLWVYYMNWKMENNLK